MDFTYEFWRFEHPQDDENQPYRGDTHYYDYTEAGLCNTIRDGWAVRGAGSSISCPSNIPGMSMTGEITNTKAGQAGSATPVVSARPGGFYRMWMRAIFSDDTTVKFGLDDGLADTWSADIPVTPSTTYPYDSFADAILELPLEASEAYPLIQISGPINSGRILEFKYELLFSIYRVTAKTLNDGQGNSYTFTYGYEDPAVNDEVHSDRICSAITGYCREYIPKYSEFRGHRVVTETGPDGRVTITTYNQDDVFKGRPVSVNTSGLQIIAYTYESTALPFTSPKFTGGYAYKGLGRDWVRTTQEEKTYLGGTTTMTYTYESTYGNLTDQAEYEGTATGLLYRTTHTDYFPNTSGGLYLVGLPARQQVKNGSGTVLAETLNLYDGANTYNTAPAAGKLTAVRTLMQGADYSQTSYTYDAWGNQTSVTTWSGYGTASSAPTSGARTTTTVYDSIYHTYAVSITNPLNQTTTIGYDYSLGLPTSETDPNGATITAEYDAFGRMTKLVRPGDTSGAPTLSISYSDTSSGLVATLTQKIDAAQSFVLIRKYDGMGRNYQSSAGGILTDLEFNAYGQAVSQSTPHASGETAYFTTTTYDPLGRPLTITAPDGTQTAYTYNGLTTTVTDANGHSTTTDMDVWGRTTTVTPPAGPSVSFTYDPLGNLLTVDRGPWTVELTYDKAGRKLSMDDPDMGDWVYTYDALGNLLTQTDARGCVLTMTYDPLNRLTNKASSGAGCGTQVNVTYTYDVGANGIGRRASMGVSGGDYTSWTYDARGRVVSESKQIPGGGQFVTSFTYNSADLPVTLTYPDGEVVTHTYNNRMLLDSLAGTSTYVASTTYDSAGRIDLRILGNSRRTDYTYYPWTSQGGRLQTIKSGTSGTPNSLQDLTYAYDPAGNVLTITDAKAGPQTQAFAYDALDRLTNASASGGTSGLYSETYAYDPATGNLSAKGGVNYTYASGHAHAVSSLSNGNTYQYDANGNMTTRHVGSQTFTLNYDAENRLVSVSGAAAASFLYDGDGKQVKAVVGSTTTYYIGAHYQVDNGVVTKYYLAGASRIAMRKGTTLYYLLSDHLGSTSLTLNSSGSKIAELRYRAWGETRYSSGTTYTPYQFTSQRNETSLGLYFYNARWYDPSLGRFTSADTLVPAGAQGVQAWDRYAFVNNNPVRYTDPTGHDISGWCGTFCSSAVKFFDKVGVIAATIESVAVDAFAVSTISAGCTTGAGCGPAIALSVGVDIAVSSYGNPVGTVENIAGNLSWLFTVFDDTSNGSTYLALDEAGGITIGIGQNTIVSTATMLLGHIPESNLDLLISAGQLLYDETIGEATSNTLVEFRIPPPPDLWGDPSEMPGPPPCVTDTNDLRCP